MSTLPIRLASIAVELPTRVMTNAHFTERFPAQVQRITDSALGRLWRPAEGGEAHVFDEVMAPFLRDPFRGCVQRHWLAEGEKSVDLEERAALAALAAAGIGVGDVDAVIDAAFFPDQVYVGNAPFLARRLGFHGPAFNIESACSGVVVSIITAAGLVASGAMKRVLVVTSCNYSRVNREDDTISWGNGDGAAAIVVERAVGKGAGLLGFSIRSTQNTCGMVTAEMEIENGVAVMRMRTAREASNSLRDASEQMIAACAVDALNKAGLTIADVDVVTANCPTAWYQNLLSRSLGIDVDKVINVHPRTANIGPALFPVAFDEAVRTGRVKPGGVVLAYAIGSVSNAAAFVLRVDETPRRPG